jgi:hypothetical protein
MDTFDLRKYLAEGKLREDETLDDADRWVEFLEQKLDLENLKQEFGATLRSEEDYAIDYFNVLNDINQSIR